MHDESASSDLEAVSGGCSGLLAGADAEPGVVTLDVAVTMQQLGVKLQVAIPKVAAERGTASLGSAEDKQILARIILTF